MVKQGTTVFAILKMRHATKHDNVITCFMARINIALEMRQCFFKRRTAIAAHSGGQTFEIVIALLCQPV